MSIKYRAVHARNSWRKVGNHHSLDKAIDGPDGAKALLLRRGRIGKKWIEHGAPLCIFVWEEGQQQGHALRLSPGKVDEVQTVTIPIDQILRHEVAGGCSESDIKHYFESSLN